MTLDGVVLDTWAWWEILHGTALGKRFSERYLEHPDIQALTLDVSLAEISAKLARSDAAEHIERCLEAMESTSRLVGVTGAIARAAGPLIVELRKTDRNASLVDAIVLAAARERGARLVSNDACFAKMKDVVRTRV
ncbi:MAG: PIN domain-containing protein [Thermoplasmatota archaeon]